jgi:hypothetical protein
VVVAAPVPTGFTGAPAGATGVVRFGLCFGGGLPPLTGAVPGVIVPVGAADDGGTETPGVPVGPGRTGRLALDGLVVVAAPVPPGLTGPPAGAVGIVPIGPGLAGIPPLDCGAVPADPGVMVLTGAADDDGAEPPDVPVAPGRAGRLPFDGLAVVAAPVAPGLTGPPAGAVAVVPIGPGLVGMPPLVWGAVPADPGVMVLTGAGGDNGAETPAPVAPGLTELLAGTMPVVPIGPGPVGTPPIDGGAVPADPGVMVLTGALVEGGAETPDAPVAPVPDGYVID